jgi:hypothetical protein
MKRHPTNGMFDPRNFGVIQNTGADLLRRASSSTGTAIAISFFKGEHVL